MKRPGARRLEGGDKSLFPTGAGQHSGDDVGKVEKRRREKNLLDALIGALDDQQPNRCGSHRHADVTRDVKQLQAAGDAGELRHHVAEVGDDQPQHHEKRDPQSVLFADEVAEPFSGDRAHAGRHFLHDDEGDGHGDHDPQQQISELRAGGGVGVNSTGVVVDVSRDEAWADNGQQHQEADSPNFETSGFGHVTEGLGRDDGEQTG